MTMKTLGALAGALILSSAAMAQTPSVPQSPTGGPLKTTTGSSMPAPGLSGRHPNTATTGASAGTAMANKGKMAKGYVSDPNAPPNPPPSERAAPKSGTAGSTPAGATPP